MAWRQGLSWTRGYWVEVTNPDNTRERLYVHGGPFLYFRVPIPFTGRYLEFYAGFRPTPPWSKGYGNEGLLPWVKAILLKFNMGNLGFALRIKKQKEG